MNWLTRLKAVLALYVDLDDAADTYAAARDAYHDALDAYVDARAAVDAADAAYNAYKKELEKQND